MIAILIATLWRYARGAHESSCATDLTDDELAALKGKSMPGLLLLVLSTIVAIFLPTIGAICFLACRRSSSSRSERSSTGSAAPDAAGVDVPRPGSSTLPGG